MNGLISRRACIQLLKLLLVLNLLDGILTILWLELGLAIETNPFMASAYLLGPVVFMTSKLTLVSAGVWIVYRYLKRLCVRLVAVAMFLAYFLILCYHLVGLTVSLM